MLNYATYCSDNTTILKKLTCINEEVKQTAKQKAETFRNNGVLLSDFTDDTWKMTDQRRTYNLNFSHKMFSLRKILGKDKYQTFKDDLKYFTLMLLGSWTIECIRRTVSYIIDETEKSNGYKDSVKPDNHDSLGQLRNYLDFLQLQEGVSPTYVNLCNRVYIGVQITRMYQDKHRRKRPELLNEFDSYFKFDRILSDFWTQNTNKELRAYYFPIYLFWKITTIIPSRVTEFCVIERDCITQKNGKYYLTIRRSRLKGGNRIQYYQLDKDFVRNTYEITKSVYELILEYQEMTEKYPHPYNLLFSVGHLNSLRKHKKKKDEKRPFCSEDLNSLLKDFYATIVSTEYKIVDKDYLTARYIQDATSGSYQLMDDEIMMLHSKHTRHLAMINLIIRGCNPMVIKEFAGHTDASTSANYYGNVTNLVKCATKYYYNMGKQKTVKWENTTFSAPERFLITPSDPHKKMDHGSCYSKHFCSGDPKDCLTCNGDCDICSYFIPDDNHIPYRDDTRITQQLAFIINMLQDEQINSHISEYQKATLNLQKDIAALAAKYIKEELDHAG